MDRIIRDAGERMSRSLAALREEFATVRTGRATAALLNNVRVQYYGSEMPVNQLATISTPESRLLVITPWDKSSLPAIEKAIHTSDLGVNPSSDGTLIRIQIPPLNEERRQEIARGVHKKAEAARVAIRNIRRDALESINRRKEPEGWSDDEVEAGRKEVQKLTDDFIAKIDQATERKVAEVMEV